jgi:hypothetical protein
MHDHLWRQVISKQSSSLTFSRACASASQTSDQHVVVFDGTACWIDAEGAIQIALLVTNS